MENNNPKKSKAFIIAFILILLLLVAGYYLFANRAKIFDTKGVVTMQKVFAPLLGSSKNKDLGVIGGEDTGSGTNGKTITGVILTDQDGNKIIQAEAGENLKKGDVLYIASFNKNNAPIVMRAIASDRKKSLVFGVAGQDMNKGTLGSIIIEGILSGVPTNRTEITPWGPKNPLYLSDKIYGGMTKNTPFAPSFIVPVGSVISIDAINGSIRVGGILNDPNISNDNKLGLNKINQDFLNSSANNIKGYYGSVFGMGNSGNNTGSNGNTIDNNNGFILNPISIPGSGVFSNNLPTVTVVASPAIISKGEISTISWISTKSSSCNAGIGNETGTTGSFKTGALSKSKSFSVTCTGANGSKSTGNTSVTVNIPSVCINGATNAPDCTTINGACINKANNPPLCDTFETKCLNNATNPPLCTTINGACINKATNPPLCTTIANACVNKATNPPECTTINGVCINKATNPPLCTDPSIKCTNKATNPPLCTIIDKLQCLNKATNPPRCTVIGDKCINNAINPPLCTISPDSVCLDVKANNPPACTTTNNTCQNGSTNYPLCNNITNLFPSVKVTAKPASIKEGGSTVISWSSTKAVSCDAGEGNGKGTTGSFKTGSLTTSTSYSVVCIDAKGSRSSGNVSVTVSPIIIQKPECSDKIDNNGDSLIDEKDPNCHVGGVLSGRYIPTHYSETNPPSPTDPQCSDDIDNNGNGLIDFQDPNCHEGGVLTGKYDPKYYSEDVPFYGNSKWPSIRAKATPMSIKAGGTSTISWTSANTTSCYAGIGASTLTNASFITEALFESRSYSVTCKGASGEVSSDVFVNVSDEYKFPVVTVTATPTSVNSGGSSKISWTSTNATVCSAGAGNGTGTSGSFSTGPLTKTTSYTVSCIGPNGQRGGNTSVSINGDDLINGKPECSDGVDNNGNRLIDINEPNCHIDGDLNKEYIPGNLSESIFPTECSDGVDNNNNGLIDKEDPNCHVDGDLKKEYLPKHISESITPTQCSDGIDNDGDGNIDAEDPGCHTDGDMTKDYIPTWNSEKDSPTSPYENTCKLIDSTPLEFTDTEKAQLDELLRKFYLIAPNLRTEDDINIAYSEITQYQNFSDHLKTLINQCKVQTADPAYTAAGGPTTKYGNPWYKYSTLRGSYIKLPGTSNAVNTGRTGIFSNGKSSTPVTTEGDFDCKYVSGWFSGNGADGKDCDTYNKQLYTIKQASCTTPIQLSASGRRLSSQDLVYQSGLKNKCIWNPGAKITDLEKIFNVW